MTVIVFDGCLIREEKKLDYDNMMPCIELELS